jgi:hypothetical protein
VRPPLTPNSPTGERPQTLAAQPTEIDQVLDIHAKVDVLCSYLKAVGASRELTVRARELTLRSERQAGVLGVGTRHTA